MNRNAESHFSLNPTRVDLPRSTFDRPSSVKTTFNAGEIIPFYVDPVLPGDTFSIKTSKVVRMQTLLTPIMDNIYLDTYWFYVPSRLVWEHWKEMNGENTQSPWIQQVEYNEPQITAPTGGWNVGTIADYMGLPVGVENISVSALPFRAYALIMNEWFRDQNLTDPLNIPIGDATVQGVNTGSYVTDVVKGGLPFRAAKYHDYFTSGLPSPQKGPDVLIPIAAAENLPVVPLSNRVDSSLITTTYHAKDMSGKSNIDANGAIAFNYSDGNQQARQGYTSSTSTMLPVIDNLWAVQPENVAAATINQLRMAFQIQKLYERDALGGSRYIEQIRSHFGVVSPDARLQRPEYLGGNRIPITINQVIQQSATGSGSTPQGNTAAMSLTTDTHFDVRKSFVEHGYVIGLMVARYNHTYQQGIERFWSRKDRFDYYWPVFANIGNQAILNKEIYAQGTEVDDEVFAYQEAWADYRYKPNRVCGELRSVYEQSLDIWHLADNYSELPRLSDEWIREDSSNIDRVIAVSSQNAHQFFADIFIVNRSTRPMPMYSIPGLIDHH